MTGHSLHRTFTACRVSRCIWISYVLLSLFSAGLSAQVQFLGTQRMLSGTTLVQPYGLVQDAAGNLYVTDTQLREVACYTPTGSACGGIFPVLGLDQPRGLARDGLGNLYLADAGAGQVLEIALTASGYQAPVVLIDGLSNPQAVAVDGAGNLFVSVTGSGQILELPRRGNQFGAPQVVLSGLLQPTGLVIDSMHRLIIAEQGMQMLVISSPTPAGYAQPVRFVSVPGQSGQNGIPDSLLMDATNHLYISDITTHQIIRYQTFTTFIGIEYVTIIGSGLQSPGQVVTNAAGVTSIADSGSGGIVQVTAQNLPFPSEPIGTAAPQQSYLFSVSAGTTIAAISVNPLMLSQPDFTRGTNDTCVVGTYSAATTCSVDINFQPRGSGARGGAIEFQDTSQTPLLTQLIAGSGQNSRVILNPPSMSTVINGLVMPVGVAVDAKGDLFVSDGETFSVNEYTPSGSGYQSAKPVPVEVVNTPAGLATDAAGNLIIASSGNDRVIEAEWNGQNFFAQQDVQGAFYVPSSVSVSPNGSLCVANTYENKVNCYTWSGQSYIPQPGGQNYLQAGTFTTSFPLSVATDMNGDVFWTMPYQWNLMEYSASRQLIGSLWFGRFQQPTAVALDADQNLYVLDDRTNCLMMLVFQNGGYQAPIVLASGFNAPQGLAVDAVGNLYVADSGNHRVVKITMTQPAPLSFAPAGSGHTSTSGVQSATVWSVGSAASSVISVSYPPDFPAATGNGSSCVAGMTLAPGSSCLVSVSFQPTQAGMQFNESATVQLQMANGQMQTIAIPLQGNSLNLSAQTIQFPVLPQLVYGQQMQGGNTTVALQATASSGLPVRYQVLSGPGVLAGSGNLLQVLGAGTIAVQATQPGNGSFAAASAVQQSIIVLPATLTVTASSQQIAYGSSASSFGYTITGFVAGDTSAVVSGNPVITTSAGAHPAAGTYPIQISAGTLSASNYTFAFVPGTLQVTPAQLQVVATSVTSVYGQPLPPFSYTLSGFVGGDTAASVHGQPGFVTAATSSSPVGSYTLAPQQGSLTAANYSFHFVSGTVQITPGLLTVAASNLTIVYGSSMPTLSYTVSGFRNGDTAAQSVSGTAVLTTSYRPGSGVGAYPIQIAQGTLSAKNYTLQLQAGTLTVSAAMLYLQPDSKTMEIGQPLPTLTYQALGLVAGDTLATATTGAPLLSTSATPQSLPGFYGILIAQGTMRAPNYQLYFGEGLMDVVWSTNDPVNPPGVFVPPPVRLRGNPILPLHAPAPQIILPNGSLFGARQAVSGSSVAGNWPASSWTAGSPGSFIGSYASSATAWMAPAAANTGSSPCAATPQAASAPVDAKPADAKPVDAKPVDARPVDANVAAPTPPPSAQSANAYCAADAP